MQVFSRLPFWDKLSPFHRLVVRTVIVQSVMMVFTLVVSVLISRALGSEGRGIASWMLAYAGFGTICVLLGLGQASRKYIAKMPMKVSIFIVLDFLILGASTLFFLPCMYLYGITLPIVQDNYDVFLLALLAVPYLSLSSLLNDILISLGKGVHTNLLFVVDRTVNIGLMLAVILLGWAMPFTVVGVYLAAVLCRLLFGLRYLKPHIYPLPSGVQLLEAFRMMRKLIFSSYFCNLAMYFSAIWLTVKLGIDSSPKELGYFAVAKFITDAAIMIPAALASYGLPHLAEQGTHEDHTRAKRHLLLLTLGIMLLIAILPFFFSGILIHLLFGKEFMPAAPCLHILVLGMMANGLMVVAHSIIASQRHEILLTVSSGILALCISVLTSLLHGHLNAVTASYIYSLSYTVGMAVSMIIVFAMSDAPETVIKTG